MTRKQVIFDLNTKQMKMLNVYPNGYNALRSSFKKYGFEHIEGSSYNSKQPMDMSQAIYTVLCVGIENPWLGQCVDDLRVTDVPLKQHNITDFIKITLSNLNSQQEEKTQFDTKSDEQAVDRPKDDKVADGKLDLVACTIEQCGAKLDAEIAQANRTHKETASQQVSQVGQFRQIEQVGQVRQVGQVKQKAKTQ